MEKALLLRHPSHLYVVHRLALLLHHPSHRPIKEDRRCYHCENWRKTDDICHYRNWIQRVRGSGYNLRNERRGARERREDELRSPTKRDAGDEPRND
jgi:hypothetical protein